MLFNSAAYFAFFTLVAVGYFALPHRFRWALLLAASYFFYMSWNAVYISPQQHSSEPTMVVTAASGAAGRTN